MNNLHLQKRPYFQQHLRDKGWSEEDILAASRIGEYNYGCSPTFDRKSIDQIDQWFKSGDCTRADIIDSMFVWINLCQGKSAS